MQVDTIKYAVGTAVTIAGCFFLPLLGVLLQGDHLGPYLQFPPLTRQVEHAPFSWLVFGVGILFLGNLFFFVTRWLVPAQREKATLQRTPGAFSWWGWTGLFFALLTWILAWNRFSWFAPLQPYTFFPLWLGYIVTVNGLIEKLGGKSPIRYSLKRFLLLFPISSMFWWYFEYLNRFVGNWYYVGHTPNTVEYILHASLCFSTVLPAVYSTICLLYAFPSLGVRLGAGKRVAVKRVAAGFGWLVLLSAAFFLILIPVFPDLLFPFVWIAPLLLLTGLHIVRQRKGWWSPLAKGDWRPILLPALAALFCGFFWEMWNWKSLARWEYAVPFVDRFSVFAMPLLGYAGYLPFGLECRVITDFFLPLPDYRA